MGWQMWVIIGLVVLAWYQYTYPEKEVSFLGIAFDPVNSFIGQKNPLKSTNPSPTGCPDTYNPVCGENGVTYDNICLAVKADVIKVTDGVC